MFAEDDVANVRNDNMRLLFIRDARKMDPQVPIRVGCVSGMNRCEFVSEIFRHRVVVVQPRSIGWHEVAQLHASLEFSPKQVALVEEKNYPDIREELFRNN